MLSRILTALIFYSTILVLVMSSTQAQSLKWIGHLHGYPNIREEGWLSHPIGITDDGAIVGNFEYRRGDLKLDDVAFKWEKGVFTKLPFTKANWMSDDGRIVLGEKLAGDYYRWELNDKDEVEVTNSTEDGPIIEYNDEISAYLSAAGQWITIKEENDFRIRDITDDHRVFLGSWHSFRPTTVRSSVWTADTETFIPFLDGTTRMNPFSISDDGSRVVGWADFVGQRPYVIPFIWDEFDGSRILTELIEEEVANWDPRWIIYQVVAISPDGTLVTGWGSQGPDTTAEPWILELPRTVKVRIQLPSDSLIVGDVVPVEVIVKSTLRNNVTVSFSKEPLNADDVNLLEVEETVVEPFELTPDEPIKTFEIDMAILSYGTAELSSEIEFVDEGKTVTKSATEEVLIPSLKVSLNTLPLIGDKPIVNFELDEDGNPTDQDGNRVDPKIEVIVENLANEPVTAVFQGLDPRARDDSSILGRIQTLGSFPMELGTITKGLPIKREIDLQLNEDGRFEFAALITGFFDDPTEQFNVAKRGSPISVGEPFPVEVEMEFVRTATITNQGPETFFVTPGGEIKIIAAVNNVTSNSTLHFKGIEAEKRQNAFGAILTSEEGNELDPPFAHDHEVDANSSAILSGFIKTDAFSAPSGTVKWILPEEAYLIDDKTGERTDLTPDDFLVTTEIEGWLGDDNALRIVQDFSKPFPTELTSIESAGLITGNFTKATLISMGKWTDDTFDAIGGLGRVAGAVSADPSLLSDALGNGSRFVWESAELVHLGWTNMTAEEKEDFILLVANLAFNRSALLKNPEFNAENLSSAVTYTQNAVYPLFNGVSDAYASDDPERIAQLYGTITGNAAMEIATAFLPDPKFTRYVDGAELANLAEAADNIRSLNQQQKILRDVPAGPIGRRLAIDGWGIGGRHLDDVQAVLGELGMKGYARERAPKSITLSEVLDEAVLKPQAMKPKGFSDLDRLILGNHVPTVKGKDGADLDLDAITVLMWPPPNSLLRARLKGETEETIKAVIARAESRRKEYAKRFPEFTQYKEEGIPISFDYKSNDTIAVRPNNPPGTTREFDFQTITTSSGATIHIPKMAKSARGGADDLRYITGDVDWIHFSFLDGLPLPPRIASTLYEILEHCCGLQHGETVTWVNKGQAVFEGKASQIGEYLTGNNQKALLEVTGEGIRAVRIRPNLTRFAKDARNHLIFFDGGTKSLQKAKKAVDLENALAILLERLPSRKVVLPFLWFTKNANVDEDTTINGQDWTYSDDPDAVMARQADDGSLERYDGKNWLPWNPDTDPNPNGNANALRGLAQSVAAAQPRILKNGGSRLQLAPSTVLDDGVGVGAITLPVTDLAGLWADELAGHLDAWFKAGDLIVIAPGTPVQEVRTIVAFTGSAISIDEGLVYNHPENTVVAAAPESIIGNLGTTPRTRAFLDEPILIDGKISFRFEMPLGMKVLFETSDDLKDWAPISAESVSGGILLQGVLQLNVAGESVLIQFDPNSDGVKHFLRWRETSDQARLR